MRPLVVWLAGVSWDGIAGTDRHLASHVGAHADVLWVDPPTSALRRLRARRSLRPVLVPLGPHLTRLSVTAPPGPDRPGIRRITEALLRREVRRAVARTGARSVTVVGTCPDPPLDLVPGARRVYYATDDFAAGAALMGKNEARFARIERRRVAEADVVGAVSAPILERLRPPGAAFVLPNGCDPEAYRDLDAVAPAADVRLRAPIAGLVGQLSPRVDLALLEGVADSGLSLLLVGPRQPSFEPRRLDALLRRPNVTWVGPKSFEELPSYLRLVDVGLTPYADDAFNRASFPLKTLEYLSAGRPVVSTPLPAVERLGSPWIRTASGREGFAAAVRAVAEQDWPVAEIRAFAADHGWSSRAADLLRAVGLADALEAPGAVRTRRPT